MKDIEKKDWNALVGKNKAEASYEWFSFVEDLPLERKYTYCHVVYKDEKENIIEILPAHSKNFYVKDFVISSGLLSLGRISPRMKTPFTMTEVQIPLSVDSIYLGEKNHFYECLSALEAFSKEKFSYFVIIKNSNEEMNLPGYSCIELYPEVYMEPYTSWDSYIQSQKGKRGKHIRYEYKRSVESGTKTYLKEDLDGYHDLLYDMYMDVSAKYGHPVVFPRDFFKRMEDALPGYTKCLFAENKGEIIGYLFLLENDHYITCKYAGRNYQAPDPYSYFRLMYELIKHSIKKKKPVSIEKTSYEAKIRRGFKLIEKKCYIKPNLPIVGDIYTMLAKMANKKISAHIREIKTHV
jgi:predicted N-acyltransferase